MYLTKVQKICFGQTLQKLVYTKQEWVSFLKDTHYMNFLLIVRTNPRLWRYTQF